MKYEGRELRALIVTGTREGVHPAKLELELRGIWAVRPFTLVVHGAAPGVDTQVERLCRAWNVPTLPMPAMWRKGVRAGPERNGFMIDVGCLLLKTGWHVEGAAFPGPNSTGTWDCHKQLKANGFEVKVFR